MARPVVMYVLTAVYLSAFGTVGIAAPLTPEEFVLTLQAAREKYRTLSVDYTMEGFTLVDGKMPDTPTFTHKVIWRSTGPQKYRRVLGHYSEAQTGGESVDTDKAYMVSEKWGKVLDRSPDKRRPHAIVTHSKTLSGTFTEAMDLFFPFVIPAVLTKVTNENATVALDAGSGHYVMTAHVVGSKGWIRYEVDPKRNYLPIKFTMTRKDGTVDRLYENTDIREVASGLWLPFHIHRQVLSRARVTNIYEIQRAQVNVDIPDDELDEPFPKGTIVDDQAANRQYTVTLSRDTEPGSDIEILE